ncbi:MAG TPA: sugar phosphate isomerase/epimerase [Candidatus Agrococcus pullicola]|uniref:Sugar phosphate isomerase/epimerase n=1 Tax=Candidatus Agrococcus pullicola TaxID=2838429 RepID=A0A9D1YWQ4_9MICO|nr:sugar phosphate isomerase/epimerase [Candidatus Agrococcus pullicola]
MNRRSLETMIPVGLSTISVFPKGVEDGFRLSAETGFDGVEVMVTTDAKTRSASRLRELSSEYDQQIMAVHAPTLLLTTMVWGRGPAIKLEKSAELAAELGCSTVVVHPPFRWQGRYALEFERVVRDTEARYDVIIAVENMFPWRTGERNQRAYIPSTDPSEMDVEHATLDFSHCALSRRDSMELAQDLGPKKLRHIHLTDGVAQHDSKVFDEHLLPGHGNEPVAEVLEWLVEHDWDGQIVAEIKTRKAKTDRDRLRLLSETLDFAREHLRQHGETER